MNFQEALAVKKVKFNNYNLGTVYKYQKLNIAKSQDICHANDFFRELIKLSLADQRKHLDKYKIYFNERSYQVTRKGSQIGRKVSFMFVANFAVFWGLDFSLIMFIGERIRQGYILRDDIPEPWRLPYQ